MAGSAARHRGGVDRVTMRRGLIVRMTAVGVLGAGLLGVSAVVPGVILPSATAQYPAGNQYSGSNQNLGANQNFGGNRNAGVTPYPGGGGNRSGGYNNGGFGGGSGYGGQYSGGAAGGVAAGGPVARIAANPGVNNAGVGGGIPPAPVQAGAAADGVAAEDAASEADWEMPAIVGKILSGGWLMVPLGLCCLVTIVLSLERLVALRRARVIPRPFVRRFTECVEDGQLSYEEATSICEEFDCPVAEVFRAAVRRWGRPMMEIEQAVMDAGDRVGDSLRRFVRVFHAISNVAPLLGLLGTVLGMIEAFEMMGSSESLGRPDMLASGISMALVTTAGGLSVAIPAYLAYMYFSAKSDRYLGEIDKLCTRVVDSISAEALESEAKSRPRKRAA